MLNEKDGIDVEKDYSDFLETNAVDSIFGDFSSALRAAFFAGYKAAGGDVSIITTGNKINKIVHSRHNKG